MGERLCINVPTFLFFFVFFRVCLFSRLSIYVCSSQHLNVFTSLFLGVFVSLLLCVAALFVSMSLRSASPSSRVRGRISNVRIRLGESESNSFNPKIRIGKFASESLSPKVQVRESESENLSPRFQIRKFEYPRVEIRWSTFENLSPRVRLEKAKSEILNSKF